MNITLEMVDEVIERTGCSYKAAKEALEKTEGDVLEAIVLLEEDHEEETDHVNKLNDIGEEVIAKLKALIKRGNISRIIIEKDGEQNLDIPLNVGIVSAVFFTPTVLAAVIAAYATGRDIKLVKDSGDIVDFKEMAEDTFNNVKEKSKEIKDKYAAKAEDAEESVEEAIEEALDEVEEVIEEAEEKL